MYKLAKNVLLAQTEHGAVLLDEQTGRYWMINDTAAMALRCLLDGGSIGRAAEMLCEHYRKADPSQAEQDTHALLERLLGAGLVTT